MLPLRASPRQLPNEYSMDELDPRPDDALLEDDQPRARLRKSTMAGAPRQQSPESWNDGISSAGSSSKMKPRPMFSGPPPPITRSVVMNNRPVRSSQYHPETSSFQGLTASVSPAKIANIGSVMFDHREEATSLNSDSVWRSLRRQERALEQEVQQLLDLQATGLVAGSETFGSEIDSEADMHSDTGSSTPTGTFYSTATSKSRMLNSLYVPPRATAEGNVIPVRQPPKGRPMGLKSARSGLRRSLDALAELKREEDAHVADALSQRKKALVHLSRLGTRKERIDSELHTLEEDEDEPLGRELRELGTKHDTITQEIRSLEEKLVGMRNRRRWLKEKMDDVKNRREAGLSGYRGAMKDVETEVTTLLRRPPVQPLDPEMLSQDKEASTDVKSSGGMDFLRLIPERRTIEMAKTWWQDEISILERRKSQIDADRQALEEGSAVWKEASLLVTEFESNLRRHMKSAAAPSASAKGKEQMPSQEDLARDQLTQMDRVVTELEAHMQLAESKNWNLLICAIGAELEAFQEARDMLRSVIDDGSDKQESQEDTVPETHGTSQQSNNGVDEDQTHDGPHDRNTQDESDNEVPPDLLVSRYDEQHGSSLGSEPSQQSRPVVERSDSENEVPTDFLNGDAQSDLG